MIIDERFFGDVLLVSPPRYEDHRGSLTVTYEREAASELGLPGTWVQDAISTSSVRGTLRGIHLQVPPFRQGKLIRVIRGAIVDVVVDVRPGSPTFGQHALIELAGERNQQLWIPPGFGHAMLSMRDESQVLLKVDSSFTPNAEVTVAYDDPTLAIHWPIEREHLTMSARDTEGTDFETALRLVHERGPTTQ